LGGDIEEKQECVPYTPTPSNTKGIRVKRKRKHKRYNKTGERRSEGKTVKKKLKKRTPLNKEGKDPNGRLMGGNIAKARGQKGHR